MSGTLCRRCPVCSNRTGVIVDTATAHEIWSALEDACRVTLSPALRDRLLPQPEIYVRRCDRCGIDYAGDGLPGDGAFYAALAAGGAYYETEPRWEFLETVPLLGPGARVLDVGCGEGVFAALASRSGASVEGVDSSEHAHRALDALGLPCHQTEHMYDGTLAPESFDVVTAFQLVEHLESPADVVRAARALLRPGGMLVVSVPNRDRLRVGGIDPFDWPPHHLTRWSSEQLTRVLEDAGLHEVSVRFERRRASDLARGALKVARSRLGGSHGPPNGAQPMPASTASFTARLLHDHTMMAIGRA